MEKKNKNLILDKARELAYCIYDSKEYDDLIKAENEYYNDAHAMSLIEKLNNTNLDDDQLLQIQSEINSNETIQKLCLYQENHKRLLKNIDNIIKFITNEDQRANISTEVSSHKCGGCCKK